LDGGDGGVTRTVFATPKSARAVLVCGLPGSGFVGKLGADQLIGQFKAEKILEYRCDSFPPQANVRDDGTAAPLKAELYFAKTGVNPDIFVFTADAQPASSEGEYFLAQDVIGYVGGMGVKEVYTLAAYITGSFSSESRVYGAATSPRMLETLSSHGVKLMKDGGITGMNGLVIGVAALQGMEGACLLGETSGYVIDAGASSAVLEVLSSLVGVKLDTSSLKEKAAETQKLIVQLQRMSEQTREAAEPKRETRPGYIS